jgi:hypothetical protein
MTVAEQELENALLRPANGLSGSGLAFLGKNERVFGFPLFLSSGRPASKSPPFLSRTILLPQYRNKSLFKIYQPVNFE